MRRTRLLTVAVALLITVVVACEEAFPPPPVSTIEGTVLLEDVALSGVTVTLFDGKVSATSITSATGAYRFSDIAGGLYTIELSNIPDDATFTPIFGMALIIQPDQVITVNFTGRYIRTANIWGRVTVDGTGMGGVTARLTGVAQETTTTANTGDFQFIGLRKGDYSVDISGFNSQNIDFTNTVQSVSLRVGESRTLEFTGSQLRTSEIVGEVMVSGRGLADVTVSLTGQGKNLSTRTDASGQYSFSGLHAGSYTVSISGYDTDMYLFKSLRKVVSLGENETKILNFRGTRTT